MTTVMDNSTAMTTLNENIASSAVTICVEKLDYNDSGAMIYTVVIILIFAFGIMMMIAAQVARAETIEPDLVKFMKESEQLAIKQRLNDMKNIEALLPSVNSHLKSTLRATQQCSSSSSVMSLAPIRESQSTQSVSQVNSPSGAKPKFFISEEEVVHEDNLQGEQLHIQESLNTHVKETQCDDPLLNLTSKI